MADQTNPGNVDSFGHRILAKVIHLLQRLYAEGFAPPRTPIVQLSRKRLLGINSLTKDLSFHAEKPLSQFRPRIILGKEISHDRYAIRFGCNAHLQRRALLKQALDSVLGQTLDSIEVICVNDGSKDHSSTS